MKNYQNLFNLSSMFLLIAFCSSCVSISYAPKVSLDISPKTIKKTVMVERFIDNSPEKDKNNPFGGFSVTNKDALVSELALEVTNAIISDFSVNSVFKEISRRIENPDFVMKGEIKKFKGRSRMTTYAIVSMCTYVGILTWYFGTPIRANETEMELVISLYNSKSDLIGVYSGVFKDKTLASMYKEISQALPSQTNRSFSSAVSIIRDQIMNDIAKYEN